MTTNQRSTLKDNSQRFKLYRSYSISFNLSKVAKFSAVESERTVSKIREKKENFCVVFTVSMKRERKIRVLCRSHAKTAKKRDVHAKLSFC